MLYQKQRNNPRSPLSVIRNQIKSNRQSISRSISRSPSCSPVSNTSKFLQKDYSIYIPVRSSSKIENKKPKSITSTHLELKSKRKMLVKETQKLEERVKEIKKKIETEVKITRIGIRKTPRSYSTLFVNRLKKLSNFRVKNKVGETFKLIKKLYFDRVSWEKAAIKKFQRKKVLFYFTELKRNYLMSYQVTRQLNEIATRHYKLQILFNSFNRWQDFVNVEKLGSIDKSYIEEMDSLLQSFINDSLN